MFRRIWYLLNRRRLERELEEEMDAHRGRLSPEDRHRFGSTLRLREQARDAWGWAWLDALLQDLCYGVRVLRRAPGFTAAIVAVLAVGMAVALTAFQVFNAAVLRPLPVRNPAGIFAIHRRGPMSLSPVMSYPAFVFFRDHNGVLASALAQMPAEVQLGPDGGVRAAARFVSANYFADLGGRPALGRTFDSALDGRSSPEPAAVLSYGFWQRQFAADPSIIGRVLHVNRQPVVVAGVAGADFTGLQPQMVDLWLPIEHHAWFYPGSDLLNNPSKTPVQMFGRLLPGLTAAAAEDGLRPLAAECRRQYPRTMGEHEWLELVPAGYALRLPPSAYGVLAFFGTLVLLVLAVSISNAATLQIARAAARGHEMWIRSSLGAGRGRIARQLLTEALLVASCACGSGLLLSYAGTAVLLRSLELPLRVGLDFDWRVVLFTAALAFASALLFGLAPALRLPKRRTGRSRIRGVLIGAQVAATCVLLLVAALYVRGLQHALGTSPGFEIRSAVSIDPALYERGFSPATAPPQLDELLHRARAVPGVLAASVCTVPPLGGRSWTDDVAGASHRRVRAHTNAVGPEYFDTLRIPILRGRTFHPGEREAAIVSEALAKRAWPGEDPLEKRLEDGRTIVGVAANAHTVALRDPLAVEIYYPFAGAGSQAATGVLIVRTAGEPGRFLPAIRRALQQPGDPPLRFDPLTSLFADATEGTRKGAAVIGFTSVLALALAALGIGGLLSYAVSERTREIGIRVALGAMPRGIVWLVLREPLRPLAIGLACGAAAGYAISLPLRSQLYGLSLLDVPSYAAAAALLTAAAAVAALPPIQRALRIGAAQAVRQE